MLELKCLICELNSRSTILYTTVITRDSREELSILGGQMVQHMKASHQDELKEIDQIIPIIQGFQFIKNFHCVDGTEETIRNQYVGEKELMRASILESIIIDLDPEIVKALFRKVIQETKPEVMQLAKEENITEELAKV